MSEIIRAARTEIRLGSIGLEVFMLPDGSYRLSQTQVAATVGKTELSFRQFLRSKQLKTLPGIDSDSVNFPLVQREGESGAPIRGVPLAIAAAYWLKEAQQKNKTAVLLVWACTQETLVRRADAAFGVVRSEEEYNRNFDFLVRLFDIAEDQARELLSENLGQAAEIDRLRGLLDYAEQMGLWDIGRQRDEE